MKFPRAVLVYSEGYKYQLKERFYCLTMIKPNQPAIIEGFVTLWTDGLLEIQKGYAWDGLSGPAPDFKQDMPAGLVHDALYQLISVGQLDSGWKQYADRMLSNIMIEDGASRFRAKLYEEAVNHFGGAHLEPEEVIEVIPGGKVWIYE
jgi:hypothetical protein